MERDEQGDREREVEEDDKRRSSNLSLHTYLSPWALCSLPPSLFFVAVVVTAT